MSNKLHIDLERSLREAPPEVYYNQLGDDGKPLFPGTNYKKRIITKLDNVSYKNSEQIREEDAGEDRVMRLLPSYRNRGIIYSKMPPAIKVDPEDRKRFSGCSGFGRRETHEILQYETYIYDVLEFDSKLAEEVFKINSNETDEFVPATPNTKNTYIKSVVNAVHSKIIENKDDDILNYLKLICRNRPDWHDSILETVRKEHISRFPTMQAWNTSSAKKFAKEYDLPYEGDKNKNVDGLGYVRKITSIKNVFWDAMITSKKYGMKKVKVWSWIDSPKPSTLTKQRQEVRKKFTDLEANFQLWIADYLDMDIQEVRERGKGRFPIEFSGFLPQDTEATTENNGNPREEGIIQ
tara:strand:- start:321 stop:1373 length:1053 start_codon:yes stop_codon:yes gene_type:complete